jgi:hypothetical protein
MVLTSKACQLLPLSACRPVNRSARFTQVDDLTRQLLGRASGSHQIDHLSPEPRRIGGSVAGIRHLKNQLQGCPSKRVNSKDEAYLAG